MPDGLGGGGEPAGITQERPDDRRDQRPYPVQFPGQGLAGDLAAGERGDLGVYWRERGLQVVHPAQRSCHGLRARRGQADVLAVLQQGTRLRVGEPPGQAGRALVEQGGVDPLSPGGVLLAKIPVQLQQHPQLTHLFRRDPRGRHAAFRDQGPQMTGIGLIGLRPLLGAPLMRGLGRLGQQRGDPRPCQLLGTALLNTIATSATVSYLVGLHLSAAGLASAQGRQALAAAAVHGYTTAFWWTAGIFVAGAVVCGSLLRWGPLARRTETRIGVPAGEPQADPSVPA